MIPLKPSAKMRSPLFSRKLGDYNTGFSVSISLGFELGPCHLGALLLLILMKGTCCYSGLVGARKRHIPIAVLVPIPVLTTAHRD